MHADLVGAARLRRHLHEGRAGKPLENLVPRDGLTARGVVAPHGHPLTLIGMNADWQIDLVAVELRGALRQRQIRLLDRPPLELLRQRMMGFFGTGDDDHAAGVAVEPMHDPRPRGPTRGREPRAARGRCIAGGRRPLQVPLQGTGERALPIALGWVHHHAGGLVDHGHPGIDVEEVERDFLGRWTGPRWLGHGEPHDRSGLELERRLGRNAIDPHAALLDHPREKRATLARKEPREKDVEPAAGRVGINRQRQFLSRRQ